MKRWMRTLLSGTDAAPPATVPAPGREVPSIGRLDYAAAEIRLHLDGPADRVRAGSCAKEPETVAWLERTLRAGDVFYDIGANIGAYSLVAAKILPRGLAVHAFEPSIATHHQLFRNVLLNDAQGAIFPHLIALGERTALVTFNYRSLDAGSSLHTLGECVDYKGDRFDPVLRQPVLGIRLDDLVERFGFPAPTLLKLDVDGTEFEILRGGPGVLASPALRSVLVEVCPPRGTAREIEALLASHGLRLDARHVHSEEVTNCIFARV